MISGYRYRINEVKLKVGESKDGLPAKIEKKLSLRNGEIAGGRWEIRRESVDARDKSDIRLVYSIDFSLDRKLKLRPKDKTKELEDKPEVLVESGTERLTGRPVIVGFGPCGIFAALELAQNGYKPIILERGACMEKRVADVEDFRERAVLDPESNVLFGEGGAGTFSDGKLTSGISDGHVHYVLKTFAEAGAGDDILYKHKPHIGTDVLRDVIVEIRKKIILLGGEVRFGTKLDGIMTGADGLKRVSVKETDSGNVYELETNALILAVGHSARDTFRLIRDSGISMEQKSFSIGVRMEHPQELIDRAQYGEERRLPPADYKLSYKASNGRGVYSFCMCPGGEVIVCSTEDGEVCVNGMSNRKRDSGTANSGILCDVRTSDFGSDDVLAGVDFQEKYERLAFANGGGGFTPPQCDMAHFLSGEGAGVCGSLPEFALSAIREAVPFFARKIKGYDSDDALVTAVETRSSSPVRMLRGNDGESSIRGIYPAGEGAGYAGGITSAACDGIRAANKIIERFAKAE